MQGDCLWLTFSPQSHTLVSLIGDAFRVGKKEENVRAQRALIVEALRHKVGWNFSIVEFKKKVFI